MKNIALTALSVSIIALTGCQGTGFDKVKNTISSPFKKETTEVKATEQVKEASQELDKKPETPKEHHHGKMDGKKPHDHHHGHHKADKKDVKAHHHHGFNPNHEHIYMCKMGASVKAVYNPHNETAKVTVHAPVWKLNNEQIEMKIGPSASGTLYINDKNPDSIYKWHTKNEIGVLSVVKNGKTHDINCEGEPMPENHPKIDVK